MLGLATLYAVVAVAAFIFQRRLMYFPDPERVPPASFALFRASRSAFSPRPTASGSSPGTAAPRRGGRRSSISTAMPATSATAPSACAAIWRAGCGVYMLSYRGYSGSTGSPTRARQRRRRHARLRGAAQGRRRRRRTSSSTGSRSAPASPCRWRPRSRSAASCSMRPIRRSSTWRRWPIRTCRCARSCSTATRRCAILPQVTAPLLVMHGEDDRVIPVAMGKAVYAAANAPKEIATFPQRRALRPPPLRLVRRAVPLDRRRPYARHPRHRARVPAQQQMRP